MLQTFLCNNRVVFRVCKFLYDLYARYFANSVKPRKADCVKMAVYVYHFIIPKQNVFPLLLLITG
jgi:hypothetical protein